MRHRRRNQECTSSTRHSPSHSLTKSAGLTSCPAHTSIVPLSTTAYPQTPTETLSKRIFGLLNSTWRGNMLLEWTRKSAATIARNPGSGQAYITTRVYHRLLSSVSSRTRNAHTTFSRHSPLDMPGLDSRKRRAGQLCRRSVHILVALRETATIGERDRRTSTWN
ncbi:hypothetical protein FIBSPDRAFT_102044 [Athelia psychrophila]|uniref:Uncharacterized protein n=1 Tax=Athelia psychrophila TaxID=1759441 RepID=A0A166DHH9_9AGAM|nr:hypothetical protein FIBSPDRAFT_102044 [Fibularhizoctonia sp. CBS 109695]